MRPGASPVWEQVIIGVFGPPIMAVLFKYRARGWAHTVQGENISEKTQKRQKIEFWGMLILMYLMMGAIFIYAAISN